MTSRPIGNPSAHGVRALVLAILPMAAPFLFDATALAMPITISSNVTAVSGDITINNGETAGPGDDVIVTGTGKVNAMNGSVFINTGDNIDLQAGSTITASNALNLHAGVSDIDGIGDITIVGLVQASGPVAAVAGPGDDTVTVDFPNGASLPSGLDPTFGTGGKVRVTYFDFRNDVLGDQELTTDLWFRHSHDGGATWSETHLAGPFDLCPAPSPDGLYPLGDYFGLAPIGRNGFGAAWVQTTTPPRTQGATDTFFARLRVSPRR